MQSRESTVNLRGHRPWKKFTKIVRLPLTLSLSMRAATAEPHFLSLLRKKYLTLSIQINNAPLAYNLIMPVLQA